MKKTEQCTDISFQLSDRKSDQSTESAELKMPEYQAIQP